ncbi:hypothetical protein [Acidovorax sp.]|uniref:hypothetical protein n=1 Tax=Acidovorax sp. TaxID=1872122 RepID=UPI00261BA509|nr:hypothetical protein [Acidovorax sp.]
MGIALLTLPALQNPLRSLKRLFLHHATRDTHAGGAPVGQMDNMGHMGHHRPAAALASAQQPAWGTQAPHGDDEAATSLPPPRPTGTQGPRPLRGNWPFTVRPPVRTPDAPTRQTTAAHRSFLPMPSMGHGSNSGSSRHAFFASLAADAGTHRSTRVLRRASDTGTGRLVIAGRMADVCAELDRMAASEAVQA